MDDLPLMPVYALRVLFNSCLSRRAASACTHQLPSSLTARLGGIHPPAHLPAPPLRQILPPTRPLLVAKHPLLLTLAAGLLPFGAIFVELYFALSSFWEVGRDASSSAPAEHGAVLCDPSFALHRRLAALSNPSTCPACPAGLHVCLL